MTAQNYPAFASIKDASAILGPQRSTLYAMLARHELRAVKCGSKTLIDIPHALEFMRQLPAAEIAAPRQREAA